MKKILTLLLIWVLAPFALLVMVSCLHHHMGGSNNELTLQNDKQQHASLTMRLYREHPWYHHLLNPIVLPYHPHYLVEERHVEGSITLDHIRDGDILRLYVRRDTLPLQCTFQGEHTEAFLIDWKLIGEELEETWESECQFERLTERKFYTLMNPQRAGIALIWQRQEGQWSFQRASWVAKDRHSLQQRDRDGEELSKQASSSMSPSN